MFKAIEALLKGLEIPLPPGTGFSDSDGTRRTRVRVRWWDPDATTYRIGTLPGTGLEPSALPATGLPEHVRLSRSTETPVFFGHYWFTGEPTVLPGNCACVDYSIAKGGKLAAYRWDGESTLDSARFAWV